MNRKNRSASSIHPFSTAYLVKGRIIIIGIIYIISTSNNSGISIEKIRKKKKHRLKKKY